MTYCCSVFPKIANKFTWQISALDENRNSPYFYINYWEGYPINFCPSCGADIRGIVITKDEFDKLK